MKNLFKKKQHQQQSNNHGFKTPQKSKHSKKSKTPPMTTPSPPSQSLQVKVISNSDNNNHHPNPNPNPNTRNNRKTTSSSSKTRIPPPPPLQLQHKVLYDASAAATNNSSSRRSIHSSSSASSSSTTLSNSSSSSMIASLINCASETVSDQYESLAKSIINLDTIPEERVNMWGMAPDSDDEDEDDLSLELRRILHDDDKDDNDNDDDAFECVLQDDNDDSNQREEHPNAKTMTMINGYQYCQPCTEYPSYYRGITSNNYSGRNDRSATTNRSQITKNGNIPKDRMNTNKATGASSKKQNNGKKKILGKLFQKKTKPSSKSKSTSSHNTKSKKTKKPKWKMAKDPQTNRIYFYHTTTQQVSWTKPQGFQEWKATLDSKSKKFYFYNVLTKETTWNKPKEFVLWKKVEKEVDDRGVGSGGNGGKNAYYYNVLTREVRWTKPDDHEDGGDGNTNTNSAADDKKRMNDTTAPTARVNTNNSSISEAPTNDDTSKVSIGTKNHDNNNNNNNNVIERNENSRSITKDEGNNATIPTSCKGTPPRPPRKVFEKENNPESQIIIAPPRDDASSNHCSLKSDKSTTSSQNSSQPGKIVRSTEHDTLRRLLFTYCPGEKENNSLLLSKSYGNEAVIIKALQSLIHETPFDELRLAIFSFVKMTLKEMGESPFDENKSLQKVTVDHGDDGNDDNDMDDMMINDHHGGLRNDGSQHYESSLSRRNNIPLTDASYSLNSKVFSIMTGKSNISNSTHGINNTTRSKGIPSKPYSFHKGKSGMSNSTMQVSNMIKGTNKINESCPIEVQGNILVTTKNDGGYNSSSYGDLTETEEEDIVLHRVQSNNILLDLSSMEGSVQKKSKRKKKNAGMSQTQDDTNDDPILNKKIGKSKSSRGKKKHRDGCGHESEESAYAADCDGSGDEYSFNDEALDDISALSDSLTRPSRRRQNKEKKKNAKKSAGKRGQDSALMVPGNLNIDTSWNSVSKFIAQVEDSIRTSPANSIGYEEIPRTKVRTAEDRKNQDNFSHSSWDDDTLSSNFCSEDDDDVKRMK